MKRAIGWVLLTAIPVVLMAAMAENIGVAQAAMIWGLAIALVAAIALALHLIID
jgi:hypothetical protein